MQLANDIKNDIKAPKKIRLPWWGGFTLEQLRDFASGIIETGLYRVSDSEEKTPTARDLLSYFRGAAALLIEVERELAVGNKKSG